MTELMRVKTRWTGFAGGPGYTVMHFRDFGTGSGGGGPVTIEAATAARTRVGAFVSSLRTMLPLEVRLDVLPEIDILEDTTGQLVNTLTVPAGTTLAGEAPGNYAAALGAVVNWKTGGVRNGRRVRGKSFLVPFAATAFDVRGQLSSGTVQAIRTGADALASQTASPSLGVYARPTVKGAADGAFYKVTSVSIPTLGAVLRSRRD